MGQEVFANNASSFLSGSLSSGATSLTVASATGFPTTGNFRIIIDSEILLVTAVSGTTFTVTRAQEGTAASAHSSGAPLTHIFTAASVRNILQPIGYPTLTKPPSAAGWTILNQGSATLTDNGLTQTLNSPGAGSQNVIFAYITAPATPYTITALFLPTFVVKAFLGFQFGWTDATKLAVCTVYNTDNVANSWYATNLASQKYTTTTAFSADYASYVWPPGQPYWLRAADDGVNRTLSYSGDGLNFQTLHQVTRTDFLTPSKVGWGLYSQNNAVPNLALSVTLASWLQG